MSEAIQKSGREGAALVVATCLALGAGAAHGVVMARFVPAAPVAAPAAPAQAAPVGRLALRTLPPLLTNLAMPAETWVRVEAALLYDPADVPDAGAIAASVTSDLLAYLRTLSLRDLQGPEGFEYVRQDMKERVALRSAGKVRDFVIQGIIVQ